MIDRSIDRSIVPSVSPQTFPEAFNCDRSVDRSIDPPRARGSYEPVVRRGVVGSPQTLPVHLHHSPTAPPDPETQTDPDPDLMSSWSVVVSS